MCPNTASSKHVRAVGSVNHQHCSLDGYPTQVDVPKELDPHYVGWLLESTQDCAVVKAKGRTVTVFRWAGCAVTLICGWVAHFVLLVSLRGCCRLTYPPNQAPSRHGVCYIAFCSRAFMSWTGHMQGCCAVPALSHPSGCHCGRKRAGCNGLGGAETQDREGNPSCCDNCCS